MYALCCKQGCYNLTASDHGDVNDYVDDASAPGLQIVNTSFTENRAFLRPVGTDSDATTSSASAADEPSKGKDVPFGGSIHVYSTRGVILTSLTFTGDTAG